MSSPKSSRVVPIRTVIARIIRNRPTTVIAFREAGIKLRYLDEGVFRRVFKISGCPLVVKFPLEGEIADGVQHSISEVARIKRLSRVKDFHPHIPQVFYHDKKNGVLVMRYYAKMEDRRAVELLGKVVQKLVSKIVGVRMSDIHTDNVREASGRLVFIDLGY